MNELVAGTRVAQYELIRELGRGGMGVVWAARDTRLGRRVAVKFLLDASRQIAERFLTEARATAQCGHENIVVIHEVSEYDGTPYMVLELLEGMTLRDLMGAAEHGHVLAPARVVDLALPIARALARAHELGIVHRDLKPENVFVTASGQVKVLDFGIAKALGGARESTRRLRSGDAAVTSTGLTQQGTFVGTLPYMSPEQLAGESVDHRADLWALGIILFEMLTGRHPVSPFSTEALIEAFAADAPLAAVRDIAPATPPELAELVDACLRKATGERVASAGELARRLEDLVPGRRGRSLAADESPYPGLAAFLESDANRFFGRAAEIARLAARVRESPLIALVGPSGVGKSSLVRAGLAPALAAAEAWQVVTVRPGRAPIAALASMLQRLLARSSASGEDKLAQHRELVSRLRDEPGYLGVVLRERALRANAQLLLFVDQLEELYTLVPDADERRAFARALRGAADDTAAPVRVVVSMRSDLLDRAGEEPGFVDDLARGLVFLAAPDRASLRDALVLPLELVGYRFEDAAIVDAMLDAMAGTQGALPLLQFAAARLWDARDRQRRVLTRASHDAIGGVGGALATHADDVVARLDAGARATAQRVLRRLVTPERTRAIADLADLGDDARIVDLLVGARLLVVHKRPDGTGSTVELVHESLIQSWPALRRWLDEDHEGAAYAAQVSVAAKQWETRRRPAGLLWRGDAVTEARRWYGTGARDVPSRDREFLLAAFALADRGRRVRRGALVGAFALLAMVASGASIAAIRIRSAEQAASEEADRERAAREQVEAEQRARDTAEQKRATAEQRLGVAAAQQKVAEQTALTATDTATEAQQHAAEAQEHAAAADATLASRNQQLESALAAARAAKDKAELAAAALARTKTELEAANATLREENARLEAARKKLASELK